MDAITALMLAQKMTGTKRRRKNRPKRPTVQTQGVSRWRKAVNLIRNSMTLDNILINVFIAAATFMIMTVIYIVISYLFFNVSML